MRFKRRPGEAVAGYGADELARKHLSEIDALYERLAVEQKEVLVTAEMKRAYAAILNTYGHGHIIARVQASDEQSG